MAEHDPSYKLLFSHREMVADLIRGFVHEDWVAGLDFGTLERVRESGISQDLREREDDIVWRVRWGERWLYVYLILEFQVSVDRFMAVRMLTYVGLLYEDLIKAGEIPKGGRLPPVLPVVLYNGQDPWSAATGLDRLMEPDLPAALRRWQPQLRYLLLEERSYDETELARLRNVAAALFRLEQSRMPADIERVLETLVEWLSAPEQASLRRAFVVWLKRVLLPARVPGADIPEVIELQEMRTMLAERVKTWTEEWKREAYKEGMEQGIEQGMKQGMQQGVQQGIQQGMEQGMEQGRRQGEAKILRGQLAYRFGVLPDWVDERLVQATEAELEIWGTRLLDSQGLEEIFRG